jgi:hypothetical protein
MRDDMIGGARQSPRGGLFGLGEARGSVRGRDSSASRSPGRLRIALPGLVGIDRCGGEAMDVFTKLFGEFLVFGYHCFDRIVIQARETLHYRG